MSQKNSFAQQLEELNRQLGEQRFRAEAAEAKYAEVAKSTSFPLPAGLNVHIGKKNGLVIGGFEKPRWPLNLSVDDANQLVHAMRAGLADTIETFIAANRDKLK